MTRRINGDALENRDGTAVTGDVFVFDDAHADGGEWEISCFYEPAPRT